MCEHKCRGGGEVWTISCFHPGWWLDLSPQSNMPAPWALSVSSLHVVPVPVWVPPSFLSQSKRHVVRLSDDCKLAHGCECEREGFSVSLYQPCRRLMIRTVIAPTSGPVTAGMAPPQPYTGWVVKRMAQGWMDTVTMTHSSFPNQMMISCNQMTRRELEQPAVSNIAE